LKPINSLLNKLYKGDNNLRLLDNRYLPRWAVVLIDTLLICFSLGIVYKILLGLDIQFFNVLTLYQQAGILIIVNLMCFYVFKTYAGIIRHSTLTDIFKLALSSFVTSFLVIVFNYVVIFFTGKKIFLTTSLVLYLLVSFVMLLSFRILVKEIYHALKKIATGNLKKRVAIFGVDDNAINLGKLLETDNSYNFKLIGFINNKFKASGGKLFGSPIIPFSKDLEEIALDWDLDAIMLAEKSHSISEKNEIVEQCLKHNIEVYNVPSLDKSKTEDGLKIEIKPIQIEDLLERDPIKINDRLIKHDLENKTILVTGGAGSIGSELVNQVAELNPKLIVILDQAESALHELELTLIEKFPDLNFIIELANIRNMYRLEKVFQKYTIDILYHAAAYKHVPLIERNPHEAIYVNILGTVNLAILAISNDIDKFVMVSTDKAVNPTNVMGASKRAAEMYVQSLQNEKTVNTKFITTRFGNVLGSNGSVIPHFRKQISNGGPVTVTHKEIIRYFMTIPEACQLVLQAGTMGQGGEIFVFDMGEQVKILDLAEKMIRLSGYEPYKDIDIKITGLRPGEKLYEELLNDSSKSLPTHHKKIMISKIPVEDFNDIKVKIKKLIKSATKQDDKEVVLVVARNRTLFRYILNETDKALGISPSPEKEETK